MKNDHLAKELKRRAHGGLLVCTGAGISAASGIPTFRGNSPDAVWNQNVIRLATRAHFEADPVSSWKFYLERFLNFQDKKPNPAHDALVSLEAYFRSVGAPFLLVTQNIDTLHEQAGSQKLIKVHGSSDQVRCSKEGCEWGAPRGTMNRQEVDFTRFLERPEMRHVPLCAACRSPLRPHVLWFDESYNEHVEYRWDEVLFASENMKSVLFVGTSFSVGVTALMMEVAPRDALMISIDPSGQKPRANVELVSVEAETLLPQWVKSFVE